MTTLVEVANSSNSALKHLAKWSVLSDYTLGSLLNNMTGLGASENVKQTLMLLKLSNHSFVLFVPFYI